jgi:diadenosine tetraphosphate (Ap4A) HIT family hydrolase
MSILCFFVFCVCLVSPFSYAMNPAGAQFELCPRRNEVYARRVAETRKKEEEAQSEHKQIAIVQPAKPCPFCDQDILKQNRILQEDGKVRIMLNKHPYFPYDQGIHLLIMPTAHVESPNNIEDHDFMQLINTARITSNKLYSTAYTQEYFTNVGLDAGQTVKHCHTHFKSYTQPPAALPETIRRQKNPAIRTEQHMSEIVKFYLEGQEKKWPELLMSKENIEKCTCCSVGAATNGDEGNFVIGRFRHNYVCISHYPNWPGELSVVPDRHVPAIHYLPPEEWQENMILARALLPMMIQYAQKYIRDCNSGNLYTKSVGGQVSFDEQSKYHVHTVVIPRAKIPITPGTADGNSCKLDVDPEHLASYLKDNIENLKALVNC